MPSAARRMAMACFAEAEDDVCGARPETACAQRELIEQRRIEESRTEETSTEENKIKEGKTEACSIPINRFPAALIKVITALDASQPSTDGKINPPAILPHPSSR